MGKMKSYYFDYLQELKENDGSMHIGNYTSEIKTEELPRDFDLDFEDPHGDIDERN